MSEIQERFLTRAAAHSRAEMSIRRFARWRDGVTDVQVAAVFYAMESLGVPFVRSLGGKWIPPQGMAGGILRDVMTTVTIKEMIRTGLARAWRDEDGTIRLLPSRVHLASVHDRNVTACHDPIEGMKEGRVRTVDDLTLVDCLECEASVARGGPHGL